MLRDIKLIYALGDITFFISPDLTKDSVLSWNIKSILYQNYFNFISIYSQTTYF
jgi:hypothetical protein